MESQTAAIKRMARTSSQKAHTGHFPSIAATWCLNRGRMSLAILLINLLPSRRGLSLMAAPRKPLVLMGAGSLPLARTGHRKFRVRQILRPSDSSKRASAKATSRN